MAKGRVSRLLGIAKEGNGGSVTVKMVLSMVE